MNRPSPSRVGVVALFVDALFLLVTIAVALHVPSTRMLDPLPDDSTLDYSSFPAGDFVPLSADFIERVLGLSGGFAETEEETVSVAAGGPAASTWPPHESARTVLDHPLTNDGFASAITIPSVPFTARTDSRSASRQSGEPSACRPVGGTVWYRYRPPRTAGFLANSFGSDHPVAIGVFEGQSLDDLALVDCDMNSAGNAQVTFQGKRDRTYFFQIVAPVTGGDLVFNLDPLGTTRIVAVTRDGGSPEGSAQLASVSANGRYVAFDHYGSTRIAGRPAAHECPWSSGPCRTVYVRNMATGRIEMISKNNRGMPANSESQGTAISRSGRYVAFLSWADNLVAKDTNGAADIFVRDRFTNKTERVSVSSGGREGTTPWADTPHCRAERPALPPEAGDATSLLDSTRRGACAAALAESDGPGISMSADGRYLVFASTLHGLVKPEPPHCTDLTSSDPGLHTNHGPGIPLPADAGQFACRHIYVHDRRTGKTRLVSVSSEGRADLGDSAAPFISPNGKWIVFSSSADELVDGDTNRHRDVFRHNLRTGATELVSASTFGIQGNGQSGGAGRRGHASVSNDGRWVAFISHATNLSETGDETDGLFIKDMRSGEIVAVTTSDDRSTFTPTDPFGGFHASISADGRYVACTGGFSRSESGNVSQAILVYDRVARTMTRVSVSTSGQAARDERKPVTSNASPEISADGRFVVFESSATNLDEHTENAADLNVFIHALPLIR